MKFDRGLSNIATLLVPLPDLHPHSASFKVKADEIQRFAEQSPSVLEHS